MRGPIWALIPVKPFALAKSRLAPVLGAADRKALAQSMFEHVIAVIQASGATDGVMVVTNCPEATAIARARGAEVIADAEAPRLSGIVDAALRELARRGAGGALVLMSDLPRLTAEDVAILAQRMEEIDVAIAPDFRGEGTNAIGLSPPDRLPTSFGTWDSFSRHTETTRKERLSLAVVRREGIELDVDEPEDLARMRAMDR